MRIANVVDGLTGDETGDWAERQDDSFEPMGDVMTFATGEALDEIKLMAPIVTFFINRLLVLLCRSCQ